MARDGAAYACQSCGAIQTRWSGQCPACGAWNSLVEEMGARPPGALKLTKPWGVQLTHCSQTGSHRESRAPRGFNLPLRHKPEEKVPRASQFWFSYSRPT